VAEIVIWHNPRCSKSRETLALLRARGVAPRIVNYLETPPTAGEIIAAAKALGVGVRAMIRMKEDAYEALGLENAAVGEQALAEAISKNPVLIERPVVFAGGKARIGRPPEAVLEIL